MTRSNEVFKGSKAGIWEVISDAPTRVHGHLMWAVTCPEGHVAQLSHTQLQWGCPPSICDECEQEARAKRAQERIDAKQASKELALSLLESLHQARPQEAQIAAQEGTI
jgi:hypothetical protein